MGSKKSSTATSTTSNYYDQRSVNDAGGGIIGSGNEVSSALYDVTSNTSTTDNSRTTINAGTDGGAFDVVRTVADGLGQFGLAQTDLARQLARSVDSMSGNSMDFAVRSQKAAASFADDQAQRAFDLARSSQTQAFASNADALGFVRESFGDAVGLAKTAMAQAQQSAASAADTAGAAYAAASNSATGNKTLIYAALGAVALVGVVVAFRR